MSLVLVLLLLLLPLPAWAQTTWDFTRENVQTELRIEGLATGGAAECLQVNSTGVVSTTGAACGGAGSSPGGADTNVQFNDGGTFGGDAALTFDKTTGVLTTASLTITNEAAGSGTECLQIDTSGNVTTSGNACTTGTVTAGGTLTAGLPIIGNGGVDIVATATLANTVGGTGQDSSGWSALALVTAGVWSQYGGDGCTPNQFITDIAADGSVTCAVPAGAGNVLAVGTLTADQLVIGNGTTQITTFANGAGLLHAGLPPTWASVSLTNDVTGLLATANGGTGVDSSASSGIPHVSAGTWTFASVSLTNDVVGILPAANGGTGQNSSAWSALPLVTAGVWSQYAGDACTSGQLATGISASGVLTCAASGSVTNSTALTKDQLVMGDGGSSISTFANGTGVLHAGIPPIWASVSLTNDVVNVLTVSHGGTGANSITGLVRGNGTSPMTAYGGASCGVAGQFARAITSTGGLTCDTPAAVSNLQTSTFAGLPAAGTVGAARYVTDTTRGLFMDMGTQWYSVQGVVNVRNFGATGSGCSIADDTAAINSAITAAKAASFYGSVYFPAGQYCVSGSGISHAGGYLTLYGTGSDSVIVSQTGATVMMTLNGDNYDVHDLTFHGETTNIIGIRLTTSASVTSTNYNHFHDLSFGGLGTAVLASMNETAGGRTLDWNVFHNITVENWPGGPFGNVNAGRAFWFDSGSATGNVFSDMTIVMGTGNTPASPVGFDYSGPLVTTTATGIGDILFSGIHVSPGGGTCWNFPATSAGAYRSHISIVNSQCDGSSGTSIAMDGYDNITIMGFNWGGLTTANIVNNGDDVLIDGRTGPGVSPPGLSQTGQINLVGNKAKLILSGDSQDHAWIKNLSGPNGANLKLTDNSGTTPSKTLRVIGGEFEVMNNAYSTAILRLTDAGALTIPGVYTSGSSAGLTKTVTVRDSAGTGTCTLEFTGGIYTGGTC